MIRISPFFYSIMILILVDPTTQSSPLEWIKTSEDDTHFVNASTGQPFQVWGVNYDHDDNGRLLEEYWFDEWQTVVDDFHEIKALGANTVRIHLQVYAFLNSPTKINQKSLRQLKQLLDLAESVGLYLNITGLGCYHKQDIPAWYDKLSESERWKAQSFFWEQIAQTCAHSPAVFCYDLMNEPVIPGKNAIETEWLLGELGGKHFVQRLTLNPDGRTQQEIANTWINKMVKAIRHVDSKHMITVGVIPWAHVFPNAKPLFYSSEVSRELDFTSVHFYPKSNEVDKALAALKVYDIGKPLVIEELFPLHCSIEELDTFIEQSRSFADGYIGFYWGKPLDEYEENPSSIKDSLTKNWLTYFQSKSK